jgi:methyltransferase (TIGR00027 family)
VAGFRRSLVHHRRGTAGRRGIRQQTLMARNAAAQTAFGPMVQVAIEQYEPPERRLVFDELAAAMLPATQRAVVRAMRWSPLRRLATWAGERAVPGAWSLIACRKRYIDDKLEDALGEIRAVVVLGAGMDTRAYRLADRSDIPSFEVDMPVNVERKRVAVQRALGAVPPSVHLVPVDFERDDLAAELAKAGYRSSDATFFVMEGVTQYLTEDALRGTFEFLGKAATRSRLVFTYVPEDFIDGRNFYGGELLYKRFRQRQQLWKFGLDPDRVAEFVGAYGWQVIEQAGADYYTEHYITPTGRDLSATDLERAVYCVKR